MQKLAPYGSWRSPITSDMIASQTIGLEQIALEGSDIYWIESRPAEGGRSVIIRCDPGGGVDELVPAPFNARTRVHEYGGGAYTVLVALSSSPTSPISGSTASIRARPPGPSPPPLNVDMPTG